MKFRIIEEYDKGAPRYSIQIKKNWFSRWTDAHLFADMLMSHFDFKPIHPNNYMYFYRSFKSLKNAQEEYANIVKFAYKYQKKEHLQKRKIITEVDLDDPKETFVEVL